MEICKQQSEIKIRHCRVPRLSDTRYSANGTEQEERYSRVPRLSDTRYSRKNAIVEYLGYQIPVTYERYSRVPRLSDTRYSKGTL